MNKEVMFSSKSDLWETPQAFFDEMNLEFEFQTDVCALPENAKCEAFYTPEQDGLSQEWTGVCWCNPPHGRQIGKCGGMESRYHLRCTVCKGWWMCLGRRNNETCKRRSCSSLP